jgi:prefoldin subunit 5
MKGGNNIRQTMTGAGIQISGRITGNNQITINNGSEVLSIVVKRYERIIEVMEKEIQELKEKLKNKK